MTDVQNSKKYFIETWGCQMNEEDSEKLSGMIENMGYVKGEKKDEASLIVFNTCAVRENAELKVYGNLGQLKHLKAKNPDLVISVSGCMMQQKGVPEEIKKKYPFVDIIFGTHNIHRFPELLNSTIQTNSSIIEVWDSEGELIEGVPINRESDIKAFVTIMYGCNNFCTYCIVPFTRGRERSRKPESIVEEIENLSKEGYKEVTLLGQNVNSYGKDLDNMDFAKLLRIVNDIDGIERIRFMTSHPKDLTDNVIMAIKECKKVCEHIHLPVQSGSTSVLNRMNRKYSKEEYLDLVNRIKTELGDVALTTDIIVGFPGETEEDFEETLDIISKVEYDSAYTFIYSVRRGTPAEKFEEHITEETKHNRFNRLVNLVNSISEKRNKAYRDRVVEVLVEGISKNDETKLTGRTRTGKLVNFSGGDLSLKGSLVNVKITQPQTFSLQGELMEIVK